MVVQKPGSSPPQNMVFPLRRSCEERKGVFTGALADERSLGQIWTSYWFLSL